MLFAGDQSIRALVSHLPASGRAEAAAMLAEGTLWRAFVEPARLLAGWSAFAGMLWLAVRSLKPPEPVPYLSLFALVTQAETVGVIASAASLLVSLAGGPALTGGTQGEFAGLASLAPAGTSFQALFLLRSLNIFTLWYVALLAAGMRVVCGFTTRLSAVIAVCAWSLSVLSNLAILTLIISTLHLRV
jgi:hypothetical protein